MGKRAFQNQDEASAKKNDTRLTADFTWPAIFAVSIKIQLYGYFYGNNNPAIPLTLLVLVLLLLILSTIGGNHPQFSEKITAVSVC